MYSRRNLMFLAFYIILERNVHDIDQVSRTEVTTLQRI